MSVLRLLEALEPSDAVVGYFSPYITPTNLIATVSSETLFFIECLPNYYLFRTIHCRKRI